MNGVSLVAVRIDFVIFTIHNARLDVLLWMREEDPFRGMWALPGGFVDQGEPLEAAAARLIPEKTGLHDCYLEQLYTFGDPGNDPRGPFVSIAYFGVVPASHEPHDCAWHPARGVQQLAFHHAHVLSNGIERLGTKAEYSTVPLHFLEEPFTLSEVQTIYEVLLGRELDKRNFRRKLLALEALEEVPGKRRGGAHRPARLFRPAADSPYLLKEKGILFPF